MKAVILAGGFGTRLAEETEIKPKPMVEIGGKPILWHIMKIFHHYGVDEFIICLGYKGYVIKEYFQNYKLHMSDVTLDLSTGSLTEHRNAAEPWRVTLVETGENTMTGGRLRRVREYLKGEEDFFFTYGDGVATVPLDELLKHHRDGGRAATVTAVQPPGRFGALEVENGRVESFLEKPRGDGGWINGGFFVLNQKAFDYLPEDDSVIWEQEPLRALARDGELSAFVHDGFWQAMDTLRDRQQLQTMWDSGTPPWKRW